jgi:hypothetical protein
MKLMTLVVSMKTLVLVACLCVTVQSRGLRDGDDQNEESDFTDVVNKQDLIVANQFDRKLVNEQCRRLHEHEGPDKVRELCIDHGYWGWVPDWKGMGRCMWYWIADVDPDDWSTLKQANCCQIKFPNHTPEQQEYCKRERPLTGIWPTTIGWYAYQIPTLGDRKCIHYNGEYNSELQNSYMFDEHHYAGYNVNSRFYGVYATQQLCCNDNFLDYVDSWGKKCMDFTPMPTPPPKLTSKPTTAEPSPKPSPKPTFKPTPKPTSPKPSPRPSRKPSPKPTTWPTKWCFWLCFRCRREEKMRVKLLAHIHEYNLDPGQISHLMNQWNKWRCMSGDSRVGIQSSNEATLTNLTIFKNVRTLTVGDTIRGLDKDLNPTDCLVQAIGNFGNGTVYGNYTDDHSILDPLTNTVTATGNSGVSLEVDVYSVLTSCPVGLDESGIGFTPFSTVLFGAGAVSWSDYILIHRAIVDIVKVVGPFVFSPETYTSTEEVGEYTNAFYKALLTCNRDPKSCDALEMAALELVEMSMTDEARVKVHTAFPDLGKLNMPGSIAATVTNGASVIYSWVPDWMGLNKGCVSAPLGSIETYTSKYEEQSVCCSFHYSWDVATCMGASTTLLPPSGWYPVSSITFQHHMLFFCSHIMATYIFDMSGLPNACFHTILTELDFWH